MRNYFGSLAGTGSYLSEEELQRELRLTDPMVRISWTLNTAKAKVMPLVGVMQCAEVVLEPIARRRRDLGGLRIVPDR